MPKKRQSSPETSEPKADSRSASEYLAALSHRFRPARDASDTTHWLTSVEICQAVYDLDPGAKISVNDIFDAMSNNGYLYSSRPGTHGLRFLWQLHELSNEK